LGWDNRTFLGIYFANVDSGLGGMRPVLPLDKIWGFRRFGCRQLIAVLQCAEKVALQADGNLSG
jgi:hypothetical protein